MTKKRLQHRYFPMKLTKFLRTPILKNTCERLLLGFKQQIFYRHSPSLTFTILYLDIRAFRCIRLQMFWKHLRWSPFLKTWNFINKRFRHWFFPMKFAKYLREPFLQNIGCFQWVFLCIRIVYLVTEYQI